MMFRGKSPIILLALLGLTVAGFLLNALHFSRQQHQVSTPSGYTTQQTVGSFDHAPTLQGEQRAYLQAEQRAYKSLGDRLLQEGALCDKLHLNKEERVKRIDAVSKAGMVEMDRVRKTHFQSPYNANFPVTQVVGDGS